MLFLNGKSLGRKKMIRNYHLEWKVAYEPGKLEAKGYKNGKVIAEKEVETTGAADKLKLTPDRTKIRADSEDVSMVTVAVLDSKGRFVPLADNEVTFSVSKNAKIIGVGNGNPSSHEPDKASKRKVFNGLCQVIIQSSMEQGKIELTAESPGLKPTSVIIQAESYEPKPFVQSIHE